MVTFDSDRVQHPVGEVVLAMSTSVQFGWLRSSVDQYRLAVNFRVGVAVRTGRFEVEVDRECIMVVITEELHDEMIEPFLSWVVARRVKMSARHTRRLAGPKVTSWGNLQRSLLLLP